MYIELRPIEIKISKEDYYKHHPKKENETLIDRLKSFDSTYQRRLKDMRQPGIGIIEAIKQLDSRVEPTENDYEYYKVTGYKQVYICGEVEYNKIQNAGGITKYLAL